MSRPAHRRAVGLFPFALTLAMATGAQEPVGESYEGNATAIVDVTIIDPATETVRPGQVVVTRYGKIESIKPAADFRAPGWMTTLDGRGRYLIPGLWDAHVHLSFWWEPEGEATASTPPPAPDAYREVLGRLASWGVTSVRDMGGDLDALDDWRARVLGGQAVGPTIYRAGPYVDGPKPNDKYRVFVTTAEEAREAVHALERRAVDFLKIHSRVPPEALAALVREAAAKGLRVGGHVPNGTTIERMIDLGVSTIEHVDAFFISRLGSRQGSFEEWKAAYDWHATPAGRALFDKMAATRTAFTPTLAIFGGDWEGTPEPWIQLRGWYRELAAQAHRHGVPLLAGSDLARQTGLVQPGIGLHRELEELVAIGLSPAEVLRAATSSPAAALGREEESGGVAVGMTADLVLLDANPLEDIRNTREIAAVLLRGKVLLADELHGLRGSATPSR